MICLGRKCFAIHLCASPVCLPMAGLCSAFEIALHQVSYCIVLLYCWIVSCCIPLCCDVLCHTLSNSFMSYHWIIQYCVTFFRASFANISLHRESCKARSSIKCTFTHQISRTQRCCTYYKKRLFYSKVPSNGHVWGFGGAHGALTSIIPPVWKWSIHLHSTVAVHSVQPAFLPNTDWPDKTAE